jgi:hypothetical protein
VIITATGLRLTMGGKIALSLDGVPMNFADHFYYKGCMFSNVPNLVAVFGYLNASWTLRADLISDYACRLLNTMKAKGAHVATPVLAADHGLVEDNVFDFSSGYLQRALTIMPKSGRAALAAQPGLRLRQGVDEGLADRGRHPGAGPRAASGAGAAPARSGRIAIVRSGPARPLGHRGRGTLALARVCGIGSSR